jgi:hypothetical protein
MDTWKLKKNLNSHPKIEKTFRQGTLVSTQNIRQNFSVDIYYCFRPINYHMKILVQKRKAPNMKVETIYLNRSKC